MTKLRVGITGYKGFIGYYLSIFIKHLANELIFVPCPAGSFEDQTKLNHFVKKCDVIVHLAAKNKKFKNVFQTNVELVKKLVLALETELSPKHIIFSSSSQKDKDNSYGRSKKKGQEILENWSIKSNYTLSTLIIPNVFGAFCKPFHSSVISTFCYLLNNNQEPEIYDDEKISFIYVENLVEIIVDLIRSNNFKNQIIKIKADECLKVSDVLSKLILFKKSYLGSGAIPKLSTNFDMDLFNTFRSYIDNSALPKDLHLINDKEEHRFEIIKDNNGGNTSFSFTKPGTITGNYFHTRKIERFCIVSGDAIVRLRRLENNEIIEYKISGKNPKVIDLPIYHTHNIENIGKSNLLTIHWRIENYFQNESHTYFKKL
jgi:UDP-2-acetamido-2,6-beta-L-arabino-hexul-4-ose reductase